MSIRTIVIVVVVVMAFLGGIVWQSQMQKAQPSMPTAGAESPEAAAPGGDGGASLMGGQQIAPPPEGASHDLEWTVPASWNTLEERSMRVATYGIPARGGDAEGAECAVFYFGPNQGGGAAENLDRWVGQFDHPSQPERSQAVIAGFKVYRVRVTGGYLAPAGPMMQSTGTKPGYALLGAIVEGPNGRVFFKLTGPQKTVEAAKREFDDMLKTIRKG